MDSTFCLKYINIFIFYVELLKKPPFDYTKTLTIISSLIRKIVNNDICYKIQIIHFTDILLKKMFKIFCCTKINHTFSNAFDSKSSPTSPCQLSNQTTNETSDFTSQEDSA